MLFYFTYCFINHYFLIVVSADINAHRLINSPYSEFIITDKNCNIIWYCSSYNTSNDCYKFCYSNKNEKVNALCGSRDFMNPFTSNKCRTQTKAYLNYYNNNCYTTPYSNVVVNKAGARPGGGLKGITNGRCLTGAGWCPCSKAQTHSKGKCGKIDGSVYE